MVIGEKREWDYFAEFSRYPAFAPDRSARAAQAALSVLPEVSSISRVHLSGVGVSGGCFVEAGERVLYFAASALCEVGKEAMTVFGI